MRQNYMKFLINQGNEAVFMLLPLRCNRKNDYFCTGYK
jgi:hypothetical protein